ncbi:HNH endonuclease [Paludibacter sp.]|uniref:HNH endonuclease n=1 Tax=Paludibacter sp. TaxID=1898105 RepID=UPI001352BD1C|nr:HNH endonuclease [Paludibacter sp.]MTK53100.1 HNH endonuclease [Paludibacter sp.]
MKQGQSLWTREELILAINLYCKMPFGKMHKTNAAIIELAELIGRTPSSVALKLGNFASFDPTLKARGIKGASNASKLDKAIWDEFYNNWDEALLQSEVMLAQKQHSTIEKINDIDLEQFPKDGKEKERLIKNRVNQSLFRKIVLATYNNKCCITGLEQPELLIASHIVPWSRNESIRLSPMNGLCLNALHDKAFDSGLIAIRPDDYTIVLSDKLKQKKLISPVLESNFIAYEKQTIILPDKFFPEPEYLDYHYQHIFQK